MPCTLVVTASSVLWTFARPCGLRADRCLGLSLPLVLLLLLPLNLLLPFPLILLLLLLPPPPKKKHQVLGQEDPGVDPRARGRHRGACVCVCVCARVQLPACGWLRLAKYLVFGWYLVFGRKQGGWSQGEACVAGWVGG